MTPELIVCLFGLGFFWRGGYNCFLLSFFPPAIHSFSFCETLPLDPHISVVIQ